MFARLCFAGALLVSGPSFAEPANLRMAQEGNCPGLQQCNMHLLFVADAAKTVTLAQAGINTEGQFGAWVVLKSPTAFFLMDKEGPSADSILAVTCSASLGGAMFDFRVLDRSDVYQKNSTFYFDLFAWADGGAAVKEVAKLDLPTDTFGSVWFFQNLTYPVPGDALWRVFSTAKERFSYSTRSGTRAFDARDLGPAAGVFQEGCKTLPKH